ncbi:Zn(II)2Cys6 transcription factor [Xylona heveae TC161]|uniref:Zn(II)2Cys6 transcription factor n=1 Tax=Xylona heveae (strain CBS 132557 / TC161) TaxID=1328760 RepID=A0A165IJB7_XYLHT|nr:Zn(II)2Cys6 transcription factor [Xylona heveae TC161]KZF24974.1 Zn(II)2Cys6 transcription factor [Xylona heveae TC161]
MQAEARKLRRTPNACIPCRQSKVKCSGNEPCTSCQRRLVKCRFAEEGNKLLVSERYIQELQNQAKNQHCGTGTKRSHDTAMGSGDEIDKVTDGQSRELQPSSWSNNEHSIWRNPFTFPSMTIKNPYKDNRTWIWLAPSSVWSFTRRLTTMITEKLDLEDSYSSPLFKDGDIYQLSWKLSSDDSLPDISGIPPIDYALYLFNTVKFHLGQNYRFFDEEAFITHMQEFYYGSAIKKATESRLWFVQFLLVLSFGKAFLSRSRNPRDPPGSKFFVRAMSLMPAHSSLFKDSLLAIEVLALAGLYFYSIDQRESAHLYVGQAIRIAQLEGMHTELPEEELGAATLTRCRNLWWTLYIMDRHFSSSVGLPMSTQDSDIATLINPPGISSQRDTTLSLQVKLSRLLAFILTTVYKSVKSPMKTFLETTQSIVNTIAGHAEEIEKIIHVKFQSSVDSMPKGTRHITLLYHQCVIVATRPLLLSVLNERLEKLDDGGADWQNFLPRTKSLISTGINSAIKTLEILSALVEDSLLEGFLPFDLEFTYGSAVHLIMANTLFPNMIDGQNTYSQDAHSILDEIICKGNRVAEVRKQELIYLEGLFQQLATRVDRRGDFQSSFTPSVLDNNVQIIEPKDKSSCEKEDEQQQQQQQQELPQQPQPQQKASRTSPETPTTATPQSVTAASGDPHQLSPASLNLQMSSTNIEYLNNIRISSCEILSIMDQIGNHEQDWEAGV